MTGPLSRISATFVANYEVNAKGATHRVTRCERDRNSAMLSIQALSLCMNGHETIFPYEDVVTARDNPGVYGLTKGFW